MNRAERRRMEREAGKHRAEGKKGRRSAMRSPVIENREYTSLIASGFVIARPEIQKP